jgi:hypothetical protein
MRSHPLIAISPDAVPRPGLRRRMSDALAEAVRDAPEGPWLVEIEPAPPPIHGWTLHLEGRRRALIQTVPYDHQDLTELLRLITGLVAPDDGR